MTLRNEILTAVLLFMTTAALAQDPAPSSTEVRAGAPLQIQEQGSFWSAARRSRIRAIRPVQAHARGPDIRGDHAYVFYQVPANARKYPLILWHGIRSVLQDLGNHARRTRGIPEHFPATPLQRVRDRSAAARRCGPQHGRGHDQAGAGRAELVWSISHRHMAKLLSRRAVFKGPECARSVLPADDADIGPDRPQGRRPTPGAKLLEKTGPAILVTHSHAGGMGWMTAIKSPNVRGIVSYEPGSNFFSRKVKCRRRSRVRVAQLKRSRFRLRISRSSRGFRS